MFVNLAPPPLQYTIGTFVTLQFIFDLIELMEIRDKVSYLRVQRVLDRRYD